MNHESNNRGWIMALACGGALLLSFVLQLFGLSKTWSFGIAIVVMIGLHLLLMRHPEKSRDEKIKIRGEK